VGGKYLSTTVNNIEDKNIDQNSVIKVGRLWIMGEPLLNKEVFKMIDYAKNNKIFDKLEITTNGSLLTEQNSNKIFESKLDVLNISIHGIDKNFNKITKSKISQDKIFENIKNLESLMDKYKSKMQVIIKMVEPENEQDIDIFLKKMEHIKNTNFSFIIDLPHNWQNNYSGELINGYFSNKNQIKKLKNSNQNKKVCPFPFYTIGIHSDGEVSICCVDWQKKTSIGNIFLEDLTTLWNSKKLHEYRILHLSNKAYKISGCKDCQYYNFYNSENIDLLTVDDYKNRLKN